MKADSHILMYANDLVLQSTKKKVGGNILFQELDNQNKSNYLETKIPPQKSIFIQIEVTEFHEAGEAHAQILNGENIICDLKILKINVPFQINLVSDDPDHPTLIFQRKKNGLIIFNNMDAMTYPVEWSLYLVPARKR